MGKSKKNRTVKIQYKVEYKVEVVERSSSHFIDRVVKVETPKFGVPTFEEIARGSTKEMESLQKLLEGAYFNGYGIGYRDGIDDSEKAVDVEAPDIEAKGV